MAYLSAVQAVEAAIADARSAADLSARQEVLAVQLIALANQFDHEAGEGHTIRLTTVSSELRQVLSEFGAEVVRDDSGDGWDPDAELARLTRSGPTLGDTA